MKSLNFKRKDDSYLRYLEETKSKKVKSPFNWDRLIYFILLILLALFLIRYFLVSWFYIEGDGQVTFENTAIRHTDDIRILEIFKKEGDMVCIGDTLFTYFLDDDLFGGIGGGTNGISIANGGKSDSWIEREIYNLRKSIDLNNVRLLDDQNNLAYLKNDLKRVQNEVILDAISHTNLENLELRIQKLESDINVYIEQNRIYRKQLAYLYDLQKQQEDLIQEINILQSSSGGGTGGSGGGISPNSLLAGIAQRPGYNYFTCPIEGYVTRVFKQNFEVALKSEDIITIHQPDDVHIRGYFNQEDLAYIRQGNIVNIQFPDGTTSKGYVDRFEFSTRILPEEFQKKFEPTTRSLAVDIVPLTEYDLQNWKKYYKLSVKITKRTF